MNFLATDNDNADALLRAFYGGRTPRTRRAYQNDWDTFRAFVGAETPQAAALRLLSGTHGQSNALALAYRADMVERGLSPATVNRRLASLRSLVKLARMLGLVTWNMEVPNARAEAYRDTRGPGTTAFREMLALLEADGNTPPVVRDRAVLRLLYDLGLRRGEAVALDVEDVELEQHRLWITGKGRTEKTALTLAPPTRDALTAWLEVRGPIPGPLFTNFNRSGIGDGRLTGNYVYQIVRRLGTRAGVKTAPHGLRHTAITEACKAAQKAGLGLEEVLDFSRHRDVKVLMIYRDRERNVQGQLAALVAATTSDAPL